MSDIYDQIREVEAYVSKKFDDTAEDFKKQIDAAYQRGLEDAWEAAKNIVFNPNEGGISFQTLFVIFGVGSRQAVFRNNSASQAIEKLKTYEEKQKAVGEIKVGDEVIDINGNRTLVTNIHGELYDGLCYDGLTLSDLFLEDVERIGKHYDIDKILEEMKK